MAELHRHRHPFARIPTFEHDGFTLYETAAICRYVDEGFPGPALQPADARGRARLAQIVGILDSYGYRAMVWDVFVERVRKPVRGLASDEAKIAAGLATAQTCLAALTQLMGMSPYLLGDTVTLADLYAAPMIACFRAAPEGGGGPCAPPIPVGMVGRTAGAAVDAGDTVAAAGSRGMI